MNYSLQGNEIILSQVGDYYDGLSGSGMFRWNRRDKTLRAPVNVQSINILDTVCGHIPAHLAQIRETMETQARMLQEQRDLLDGDPQPLFHYPVKANLMRHQIVGANMAMIVFGCLNERTNIK